MGVVGLILMIRHMADASGQVENELDSPLKYSRFSVIHRFWKSRVQAPFDQISNLLYGSGIVAMIYAVIALWLFMF